jgi:hypothetical protein
MRHDPMLVLWRKRPLIQIDMEQIRSEQEESFSDFQHIVADILRSGAADGTLRPTDDPDLSAALLIRIALSFILDISSENSSFSPSFPLPPYDADTIFALFCDFVQNSLLCGKDQKTNLTTDLANLTDRRNQSPVRVVGEVCGFHS